MKKMYWLLPANRGDGFGKNYKMLVCLYLKHYPVAFAKQAYY